MVDFNELKNKAEAFATEHAAQIKQGIGKAGDLVGGKIGHDKVNPIEEKLTSFVDGLGKDDQHAAGTTTPVTPPAETTPVTPPGATTPLTPPVATPPVAPPVTNPPTATTTTPPPAV